MAVDGLQQFILVFQLVPEFPQGFDVNLAAGSVQSEQSLRGGYFAGCRRNS
jgi:hypothetical protein